jgi:heat shock protein HslJ
MKRRVVSGFVVILGMFASACGDSGTAPSTSERLSGTWALQAFQTSAGVTPATDSSRYTVQFGSDGRLSMRADCNVCNGPFETQGVLLTTGLMACTRAYCGEASQSDEFIGAVSNASSYLKQDDQLLVYHDGGVLHLGAR